MNNNRNFLTRHLTAILLATAIIPSQTFTVTAQPVEEITDDVIITDVISLNDCVWTDIENYDLFDEIIPDSLNDAEMLNLDSIQTVIINDHPVAVTMTETDVFGSVTAYYDNGCVYFDVDSNLAVIYDNDSSDAVISDFDAVICDDDYNETYPII